MSASWKVHWAIIAALFKHAHTFNWTPTNEAAKLKGFKTTGLQVQPFSKDEMTAILSAVRLGQYGATAMKRAALDLESTMRYLKPSRSEEAPEKMNGVFA